MRNIAAPILLILFLLSITSICVSAQEETSGVVTQGNRYISLKIKAVDKYNSRIERQQKQLLNKLKKKEKHFEHKLKNSDSTAYAHYKKLSSPSFSSISKLSKSDTGSTAVNFSKQKNPTVDSLKGVQSFVQSKSVATTNNSSGDSAKIAQSDTTNISQVDTSSNAANLSKNKTAATDSLKRIQSLMQSKTGLSTNVPQGQGSSTELNSLKGKMNFQNYITQLITQRAKSLKSLAGSEESNIPGLNGMEKPVYYAKARMKEFKAMEEDPTTAEDKAMEYLQGSPGFDKSMNGALQNGGMGSGVGGDASQLSNVGLQTNQYLQKKLQQKFGGGISSVAKNLNTQLSQWQDKQKDITGGISETKQSLQQLRHTDKPTFKVNPMRGMPFWKRLQKQYNWQTTSANGEQPAMIQPSVMVGFKHTSELIYGVGIGPAIGLGQSWQSLHLSYQGVGLKSYITWAWQYGIGFYAGYERMYNQYAFTKNSSSQNDGVPIDAHSTTSYSESLLIGLTKTYKMSSKYNGQIQVLYDIWWQQKDLPSPIVLRFATINK